MCAVTRVEHVDDLDVVAFAGLPNEIQIAALASAGVPVGVSVAPVIPGLTDPQLPTVLREARAAGAQWAWFSALRLAGSVAEVFERRIQEALPLRADTILAKVRRATSDPSTFGERLRGNVDSPAWRAVRDLFGLWHRKLGYSERWAPPEPSPFRRPSAQMSLFDRG